MRENGACAAVIDNGSACWAGQQAGYFSQQCIFFKRDRKESIYPFPLQVLHKVLGRVSGKDHDATMWMPCFDFGNDTRNVGGRNAGVRYNHQIKPLTHYVLKDIGESAVGLRDCCMVAVSLKYPLKAGSQSLPLRYDENVVNRITSYKM